MNFDDFIRSFFGNHRPKDEDRFSEHPPIGFGSQDDGAPGENEDPFSGDFLGSSMKDFFQMHSGFHEIFKHFEEEMTKGFSGIGIGSEFPALEPPSERSVTSPRDHMLKPKSELPQKKESQGHASRIEPVPRDGCQRERDSLLPGGTGSVPDGAPSWFKFIPEHPTLKFPPDKRKTDTDIDKEVTISPKRNPFPSHSFRSVQIQTIRKPDGSWETIKTERDGHGNEIRTVTTSAADHPQSAIKGPFGFHHFTIPDFRNQPSPRKEPIPRSDRSEDPFFSKLFKNW